MSVYVFPNKVAKAMKNISPRTQMEAALMAMLFIMIGLIIMIVYVWFTELSLFMKIFTTANSLFGIMFLWSFLITTFQQYHTYLEAIGILVDENQRKTGLGRLKGFDEQINILEDKE